MELALPGRPHARLCQPSLPKPCKLEIWVPPRDQEEEGGRKDLRISWSADSVSLGWFSVHSGPPFLPHNMRLMD